MSSPEGPSGPCSAAAGPGAAAHFPAAASPAGDAHFSEVHLLAILDEICVLKVENEAKPEDPETARLEAASLAGSARPVLSP